MTFAGVVAQAKALAASPYKPQLDDLPPALAKLDYDGYVAIGFRPEAAPKLNRLFSMQLFHRGFLHRKRVALFLQSDEGPPRPLAYDSKLFRLGDKLAGKSFSSELGFAGFRLHYAFDPLNAGQQEEFLVFLGASYFRLRGKGQEYGISARAAAINTANPGKPEEFPDFTAFWISEPAPEAHTITVLALLDSPSLAGAYRFEIAPGDPSRVAVSASLHPRHAIGRLGLAPLTSMFVTGQNGPGARNAVPIEDVRPHVHDSDGLAVATRDDRLWRPLVNGRVAPQASLFRADNLVGFGLLQRERRFAAYMDVAARQEARPGLWVAPTVPGGFGPGAVELFEIPSREEWNDNIVAAFVPQTSPAVGAPLALDYTLTTVGPEPDSTLPGALARVVSTRFGSADQLRPLKPPLPGRRLIMIDFEGPGLPVSADAPITASVSASAGKMVDPVLEKVNQTGGWRIVTEWRPPMPMPAGDVVLRARLVLDGKPISETWDAVV
ncbi:MAG: glucan biosynthesis protein [Methylobacterium sp.]|uniref:glucan biosynthesis protein n=1 Tax=Methylobacterium sp. TaxID=409 RepID=UPI0025D3CD2D|nr:glucan biosynthesis protein [Methylobacterium sp.]MBX9934244.1 glucan biosynthesis protein [Methylobacterium sp.]